MNAIQNQVQLIGRTGNQAELKTFENGGKMVKLYLATNEYYKDAKGEPIVKTQWHTVIAWGRQAEKLARLVDKGQKIAVKGKLTSRSYEDKDGIKRYITEVVLSEFMCLERNAA